MSTIYDIANLGYEVTECEPNCYRIEGFGVKTYIQRDDQETIDSFADPVLHEQRLTAETTELSSETSL